MDSNLNLFLIRKFSGRERADSGIIILLNRKLNLVTGNNFNALNGRDAVSLTEIRPRTFGHVNRRVLLQRYDGNAPAPTENVRRVAAQSDIQRAAIVKIVGDEIVVQQDAGDIAGVMDAQNRILVERHI